MPTVPVVSVAGVTLMTGQTCAFIIAETWQPLASVARTVMLAPVVLANVGVPEITPVLLLSVRPLGRVPAVTAQM